MKSFKQSVLCAMICAICASYMQTIQADEKSQGGKQREVT